VAQKDRDFAEALSKSDVLLPDGISIVIAVCILNGLRLKKIAGADLFYYEMNRLNSQVGTCFFLGSNEFTLKRIYNRAKSEFPGIKVFGFSPPYKSEFSSTDNKEMISAVNLHKPDVLFIGMTAPKQEKWVYQHFNELEVGHICCIGAVFDFYAGTVKRAPEWMIYLGLEWFYRLLKEPRRMWRRYLIGNFKFIWLVIRENF
jgi:N-acetylglucosaminyldiphosphoundecaprenol N-acetyl-beta-D-mannosaminyltransferase